MSYTAPASKVFTVAHVMDANGCLTDCDPDCEAGPRHCEWVHSPSHKPGWHALADCPASGHEATTGFTRCGQPMLIADLWVPVELRDGDEICRPCRGIDDEQGSMW